MVKFKRNSLLLGKLESTYGTDPTPAGTDAIQVIDLSIKESFDPITRDVLISSMSRLPSLKGIHFSEVTFSVEMHGSGASGTAPRIGRFLQACAFTETVAASSVVYTPKSTNISSITLYLQLDGRQHKVTGAYGNVKVTAQAGQLAVAEFTFQGIWNDNTDATNATPNFGSEPNPVPVSSAAFSYNSNTDLVVPSVEFDMQNAIVQRQDISAATALKGFVVTGREPNVVFTAEMESVATEDYRADILTNTRALSFSVGSATGNTIDFSMPAVMVKDIEISDNDGLYVEQFTGDLSSTSGDDELTITFS